MQHKHIIGIMQPYFMPYIGYWQLMKAVDKYVVYDNIQYTKKGWFNRNRIMMNGKDYLFTIPLVKDSDYLDVNKRFISDVYNRKKLLAQISNAYKKAPYFEDVFELIENIVNYDNNNLFEYIYHSIMTLKEWLHISTEIIISSSIDIDHSLKGKDKVLEICKSLGATTYYNAIGGQALYDKQEFEEHGIDLYFVKTPIVEYPQRSKEFIPYLSMIDVLMNNSPEDVNKMLDNYNLI